MKKNENDTQIVMRVNEQLNRKIYIAAQRVGLTKASWLRQLAIKSLEESAKND